jgi:hypothetical protein
MHVLVPEALFTSRVFPPTRDLGIRGDLVNPLLSPNPRISPYFPRFPLIPQFSMVTLSFSDGRGWEGDGRERRPETSDKKKNFISTLIANQVKI